MAFGLGLAFLLVRNIRILHIFLFPIANAILFQGSAVLFGVAA